MRREGRSAGGYITPDFRGCCRFRLTRVRPSVRAESRHFSSLPSSRLEPSILRLRINDLTDGCAQGPAGRRRKYKRSRHERKRRNHESQKYSSNRFQDYLNNKKHLSDISNRILYDNLNKNRPSGFFLAFFLKAIKFLNRQRVFIFIKY